VDSEKFPVFSRYLSVGVLNSLVHVAFFAFALQVLELGQSLGNLLAFFVALSFSFMVNGRYTFRARLSLRRYLMFLTGMGSLSAGLGYLGDRGNWPPLITFVAFSLTSLMLGFIFTRWIFREERAWKFR
jgi:putative flippase GtrA